jgi:hypothetical protein
MIMMTMIVLPPHPFPDSDCWRERRESAAGGAGKVAL